MTDAERIHKAIEVLSLHEKYSPRTPEDVAISDALAVLRKPAADSGGLLPPGDDRAINNTGRPERVRRQPPDLNPKLLETE